MATPHISHIQCYTDTHSTPNNELVKTFISDMKGYMWVIIAHCSLILIIYFIYWLQDTYNFDGILKLLQHFVVIWSIYTYLLMCFRNYDIYLSEIGVTVRNKWRLIGRKTWRYDFHLIRRVEIRAATGERNVADFYLWVNDKRFNLLIQDKKSFVPVMVEYLEQSDMRIIIDTEVKKVLIRNKKATA